ncbi:MAG: TlpA family protein disulfide reductase [Chloroflexota bacterium]|nr:TlpA family protein disulfide reductase [Chloroflexota bacterium]
MWPTSAIPTPTPFPTVTPGPVPTLALPNLEGEELSLEEWRGTNVILNFWATWCYPCRTEMPTLAAVHAENEDVIVVGVNYEESAADARAFVEELDLDFPILLDQEGKLADKFRVVGLPTTFFINRDGQIIGSHIGPVTEEMLDGIISQLRAS